MNNNFDEKYNFVPRISFKLGSAYGSEDYKKTENIFPKKIC